MALFERLSMVCQTQSTLTSKSMQWVGVASMAMEAILTFAANYVDGRAREVNKISLATVSWFILNLQEL